MTVEEQFRDLKGQRFGVKLFWTQFRDPEALARFLLLLAIALAVWIAAGRVAAWANPSLRMVSKRKGPRQSFVTIGLRMVALDLPTGFDDFWLTALLALPELRRVGRFRVGGK